MSPTFLFLPSQPSGFLSFFFDPFCGGATSKYSSLILKNKSFAFLGFGFFSKNLHAKSIRFVRS